MSKIKLQNLILMKKKSKKNNIFSAKQNSFYFADYLETNLKQKHISKSNISEDRIYTLFFSFLCLMAIFCIKITFTSFQEPEFLEKKKNSLNFIPIRRDVVDRNGVLISRNIKTYDLAVRPKLIKDKEKFLLNIKINFPEISQLKLKKNLDRNKYFYLKKRLTAEETNKIWSMGEKSIEFEPIQSRIYPHADLYSHILGQIDDSNYGISGIEKFFDRELKNLKKINQPLSLTLDTNIQYLLKKELEKSMQDFQSPGAAGLLMDSKNGEVLSLVSLPDYNINLRNNINEDIYANKISKNLYELGSVFKTITVALALEDKIVEPKTVISNITKKIQCSIHDIRDIHEFPKTMSVEDILIQSSNIGAIRIAKKIGEKRYREFLGELNLLNTPQFELEEVGTPLKLKWDKCKLETVSFGHGIMITPLQLATAYSTITNGGYSLNPTLKKIDKNMTLKKKQVLSKETSIKINKILRKVVTDKKGTGSLADIFGYDVGGKTGTAQNYQRKKENINSFISIFPSLKPRYVLLVLIENPKPAPHIVYNYRGKKTVVNRNEAGWNAAYVAGKIIEKIGPILAINNNEVYNNHVVKKLN